MLVAADYFIVYMAQHSFETGIACLILASAALYALDEWDYPHA
jgi:hypothetical protein